MKAKLTPLPAEKAPKPVKIPKFTFITTTDYEKFRTPKENRAAVCSYEQGRAEGFSDEEIRASMSHIEAIRRNIVKNGFAVTSLIDCIREYDEEGKERFTIIDGNNTHKAILLTWVQCCQRDRQPIVARIFETDDDFSKEDLLRYIWIMNADGIRPWAFISSIRQYKTPCASAFVEMFDKYFCKIKSTAVIADIVSGKQTMTKKETLRTYWSEEKSEIDADAEDLLKFLARLKDKGFSISQPLASAIRDYWRQIKEECYKTSLSAFENRLVNSLEKPHERMNVLKWKNTIYDLISNDATLSIEIRSAVNKVHNL